MSWVGELSTQFFSTGWLSNGIRERNEIRHKGSLGDEDEAQMSNTRIAQRKRAIPHWTMKARRNMTVDVRFSDCAV